MMSDGIEVDGEDGPASASLGVWIGLILIAAASFWCQATVTEERFVPALNVISTVFHIPDDIAGATLMAAGASSPELFSSIVSLFITHSSLGLGTVFGSEVFNQLIICAGAVYSSSTGQLELNKAIFTREVFFYALGILALYIGLQDVRPLEGDPSGVNHIFISFGEAWLVFGGYVFYVIVCANMDAIVNWFSGTKPTAAAAGADEEASSARYGAIEVEENLPFLLEKSASIMIREPAANFKTVEYLRTKTGTRSASAIALAHQRSSTIEDNDDIANSVRGMIQRFSDGATLRPFQFLVTTEKPSDEHQLYDIEVNTYEERMSCFLYQRSYFYSKARFATKGWHLRWFSFMSDRVLSVPDRAQYERHRIQYPPFTEVLVDQQRHVIKITCANLNQTKRNQPSFYFMAPSKEILEQAAQRFTVLSDKYKQQQPQKQDATAKTAPVDKEHQMAVDIVSNHDSDIKGDASIMHEDHAFESLVHFPIDGTIFEMILFVFLFPLRLLMHWTVPDVRTLDAHGNPNSSLGAATLACLMCLVWLIVGSYAMVASLEALAELMNIPDAVIGYTVSAAGTSLPNYVASAVAARNGFGNMAVSNALGSNTFNIMIGLGMPWILYTSFGTHFQPYNELKDEGITEGVLILAAVLLLLVLLLLQSGFVLHLWHGHLFVVAYIAYLAYVIGGVYWW